MVYHANNSPHIADEDFRYHLDNLRNMEVSYVVDVLQLTNEDLGKVSELDPDDVADRLDITVEDILEAYPLKVRNYIEQEFG